MLAIRMSRHGAKKRPFYHIVIADSRSPRDGRFIEKVGTYNPMLPREHAQRITLNKERIAKGSGVQVQDVNKLLKHHADMLKMMKRVNKLGEKGFMRSLGGMMPPPGFPR